MFALFETGIMENSPHSTSASLAGLNADMISHSPHTEAGRNISDLPFFVQWKHMMLLFLFQGSVSPLVRQGVMR